MSKTKTVWITYDLGIQGDYKGLYTWLDDLEAKECGDSVAVITITPSGDLVSYITKEIKKKVKFKPTDRVYIIYHDDSTERNKGKFIVGGRKRAPWEGYGQTKANLVEDF
jgi:hypothetical protein